MIRLDVVQGSPEWEKARLGIPTASQFDKLITPKKLQPSASRFAYRNQILAEWLLGYSIDFTGSSGFMDRGTGMEPEARAFYEFDRDTTVDVVGFVLRDDGQVGGSPDGLIGDDGLLEIKCPAIHTHIGYLVEPESLSATYYHQAQGYLYLTGRSWADVLSYNPELPPVIVRVRRDAEYIEALDGVLDTFLGELAEMKGRLQRYKAAREAEKAELAAEMAGAR